MIMKKTIFVVLAMLYAYTLSAQDIHAISHSPEYREAYRPHYRIVEKSIFENEVKPLIFTKTK